MMAATLVSRRGIVVPAALCVPYKKESAYTMTQSQTVPGGNTGLTRKRVFCGIVTSNRFWEDFL
jgi:hypothetical protein